MQHDYEGEGTRNASSLRYEVAPVQKGGPCQIMKCYPRNVI
ncbi:unnamed protein product [Larinioides sclopetarius]|uniref:Uncharacterized protein n=1 Tax=Larinioides sclopetarius TaxID=280406 RepID=A0AAV2B621_9ARAC